MSSLQKVVGPLVGRGFVIAAMIAVTILVRIFPHSPNFTPLAAIALFSGAIFGSRIWGLVVPLAVLFLSDLKLGFYPDWFTVYGAFMLTVAIGWAFESMQKNWVAMTGASVLASVQFFIMTNLGVWLWAGLYPRNISGLVACFVAAVPFFQNTLFSTVLFTLGFMVARQGLEKLLKAKPLEAKRLT